MNQESGIELIEVTDADFAWMLGEGAATHPGLNLPPGGVDDPATLVVIRTMTKRLHEQNCHGSWMIIVGNEVAGLCSFRKPPENMRVEIGYGVAESCRNRGFASAGVSALLRAVRNELVKAVVAETAVHNRASARVLEKNGFTRRGTRYDPEDGEVCVWERQL